MNTAEQSLLLILSSTLAVFLVLAIIVCVNLIRLLKSLQNVAAKAESFVDSAENTAKMVQSTVGQLSVMKFVNSLMDLVRHKDNK